MNLKKALLANRSRTHTEKIARYIGSDTSRFKELMELFFCSEIFLTQQAAWIMSVCAENFPDLLKPYMERMINNLMNPVHNAVKRSTLRAFQEIEIPEKLKGKAVDYCFILLAKSSEAVAIKVFAMSVLLNIVKKEPDLKNELKIIIEDQMPFAKAAFLSRGKKVLKALEKIG
jgi:hypothetical protein